MSDDALHLPSQIFAGYALDLDGTVYLDESLIEGAGATIAQLRAQSRVVFVTNKPLETAATYADKLTRLGVPTTREDIVTPLDSLVVYIERHFPDVGIVTVAETLVDEVLRSAGFTIVDDPYQAGLVVVSFDRTFNYEKLLRAYRAVRNGARIVATNPDPYCPTADGGLPDCAAMLAAVEACTGARADAIVGKPSAHMSREILHRLGVDPQDAVMVGDRLLTDVAMAQELGMSSVLVLSGATTLDDLARSSVQPHYVVRSVVDLLPTRLETK